MRMRLGLCVALVLAGCTPTVPESGVGFGDYSTYLRERERALSGAAPPPPPPGAPLTAAATPGAGPVSTTGFSTALAGAAIAEAEGGVAAPLPPAPPAPLPLALAEPLAGTSDADRPRGNAPATIRTEAGEVQGNASISDEQDFGAVSARETIESDAERLARAREQYEVVQPTAVPQRPGGSSVPGIVTFALTTTHAPGTPVYRRSGLSLGNPDTACGRFGSADKAQEAFLQDGGPERDRKGIDPDGDGFACGWDPRPFRAARQ